MQVLDTNNYVTIDGTIHHNSGKSSACVIECINRAEAQVPGRDGIRRVRIAVVRNTYQQLTDTTIATFLKWIPPHYFGQYNQTAHNYFITKIPAQDGGPMQIEVLFRALDRPDNVRNLLSLELTFAWFNEVREIARMIWDAMDGRVGRFPPIDDGGCTWKGMFADTNPPDTDHWFYRVFEKEKPRYLDGTPKTEIFHQPSGLSRDAENIPNLEKGYYENLMLGKSNDFIRVYVEGEYGFVSDGKPVYPNWSPAHHVAPRIIEVIRHLPIVIGFDFARYPACVVIQQIPSGPRLNVLDAWTGVDITVPRFLQEIVLPQLNSKYMGMEWYITGDPSGVKRNDSNERNAFLDLKNNGLSAIPARSNQYGARLPAVDSWLTKPYFETDEKTGVKTQKSAFQVSPNCENLIKGFNGAYMMSRILVVGHESYKDQPEKTIESHCFVGTTMILTEKGKKPIGQILEGEKVFTPFGLRRVLRSWMTREDAELVEVEISNGTKIECTPDHKIFTKRGLVKANALQYNDILESISLGGLVKWNIQKLLGSMGLITNSMENIIDQDGEKIHQISTGRFGNFMQAGKFLRGLLSTTRMKIHSITNFQTLNSKNPETIFLGTEKIIRKNIHNVEKELLPQERKRRFGIDLQREENSTRESQRNYGSQNLFIKKHVNFVEKNTKVTFQREVGGVHRIASQKQDDNGVMTTLKNAARFAAMFLKQTNIILPKHAPHVVRVSPKVERKPVFNLTIDKYHCYYADGILVLNCHDALQYACMLLETGLKVRRSINQRGIAGHEPAPPTAAWT